MYEVVLINMPFASCTIPSIALAQLKAVVDTQMAGRASARVAYLCHDLADYLGEERYRFVSNSMQPLNCGFGDWFFRQVAWPDLPDNTEAYSMRYLRGRDEGNAMMRELIDKFRPGLDALLDNLIDRYALDRGGMVGFTSMFMQNVASFALARKIKARNPNVVTVIGGANCEYPMGKVLAQRIPFFDAVFSGPALQSFPRYVEACIGGAAATATIPGVITPQSAGSLTPDRIYGEELSIDTQIPVTYDDFFARFEQSFGGTDAKPVLPFETSRGCWWGQRAHCTFCGLNGASMGYRSMSPQLAIEQFQSLFRYAGKVRVLEAVDNILPKNYLTDVLPNLNVPEDMELFYEVKADINEAEMAVLARAHVYKIQPGIEALATSTLKLMKKGTSAFQNLQFLKSCALHGITPRWNLLVGFPGETADVYRRYLEIMPLLTHLEPPSGAFPVRFDRFSPYHKLAGEYGLDLKATDYYRLIYPLSADDLQEFAYFFTDQNFSADYFVQMASWLGKLQAGVKEWQVARRANGVRPRLYFTGPGRVYDSRFGSVALHELGLDEARVLEYLARPTRADDVIRALAAGMSAEAVHASVEALRRRRLLFEEGDRLFSLVMAAEPGAAAHATHLPVKAVTPSRPAAHPQPAA